MVADRARRQVSNRTKWEGTLGEALTNSLIAYLIGHPERSVAITHAINMMGYSPELKRIIVCCIEANPAMEESFLLIAELAFRDGEIASE